VQREITAANEARAEAEAIARRRNMTDAEIEVHSHSLSLSLLCIHTYTYTHIYIIQNNRRKTKTCWRRARRSAVKCGTCKSTITRAHSIGAATKAIYWRDATLRRQPKPIRSTKRRCRRLCRRFVADSASRATRATRISPIRTPPIRTASGFRTRSCRISISTSCLARAPSTRARSGVVEMTNSRFKI
jgi:hypothetical protein